MVFELSLPVTESLALLSPEKVETLPSIVALKDQFSESLPPHFGNIRTYISPIASTPSAIRADCQNQGCGTRAFVHIIRNQEQIWTMVEDGPQYDRTSKTTCDDCHSILDKD